MMLAAAAVGCLFMGCATRNVDMAKIRLGMSPEEVAKQVGKPYTVRAGKVYEDGQWTEVWEYIPPALTWYPKTYWIFFENGKVVQWGEPGDFLGTTGSTVGEYVNQKRTR